MHMYMHMYLLVVVEDVSASNELADREMVLAGHGFRLTATG